MFELLNTIATLDASDGVDNIEEKIKVMEEKIDKILDILLEEREEEHGERSPSIKE